MSLLSGLGLAFAVFLWGRSLGGLACGIASTLSLAAFERLWWTREARLLAALSLCSALALLTKATAAVLTIGAPIFVWLALNRSLHLALRPRVLAWTAVSLSLALSWYVVVLVRVPGALNDILGFALEPVGAAQVQNSAEHFRSLFFYLPRLPLQALPASLLLPWLIRDAVSTRFWRADSRVRFVATSLVAIFVAWSLVGQKQMHYVLPIAPFYALLCGVFVARQLPLRRAAARSVGADQGSDDGSVAGSASSAR